MSSSVRCVRCQILNCELYHGVLVGLVSLFQERYRTEISATSSMAIKTDGVSEGSTPVR
jgi:hypothetical protein